MLVGQFKFIYIRFNGIRNLLKAWFCKGLHRRHSGLAPSTVTLGCYYRVKVWNSLIETGKYDEIDLWKNWNLRETHEIWIQKLNPLSHGTYNHVHKFWRLSWIEISNLVCWWMSSFKSFIYHLPELSLHQLEIKPDVIPDSGFLKHKNLPVFEQLPVKIFGFRFTNFHPLPLWINVSGL